MVGLVIRREGAEALIDYGQVPISFTVESRLRFAGSEGCYDGRHPVEERVEPPWIKDYDAIHGEGPMRWAKRWDFVNWVVLSAFRDDQRIGGAVVAWKTRGVQMLEGRTDLACLWDLRVHPDHRGQGLGTRLVHEAAEWAIERGCSVLKVETQDINARACRFYAARGFELRVVQPDAYEELPDETMLLWYLDLPFR